MHTPMLNELWRRDSGPSPLIVPDRASRVEHVTTGLPQALYALIARAPLPTIARWPSLVIRSGQEQVLDIAHGVPSALAAGLVRASHVDEFQSWMALPATEPLAAYAPWDVAIYAAETIVIEPGARLLLTGTASVLLCNQLVIHDLGQLELRAAARVMLQRFEKRPSPVTLVS
jgi:hypothetical protein